WFFVFLLLGWALYSIYPPSSRNLVDEFTENAANRDTNLTTIVTRARELDKTRPQRDFGNLRQAIGTNDITKYFPQYKLTQNEPQPTRAILNRLQRDASGKVHLGLDLQGGTAFVMKLQNPQRESSETNAPSETDRTAMVEQAIEVLRRRVDAFGIAEPVIQPEGTDRILVQLPGLSEDAIETARTNLQKAAFLEFRLVHPESGELVNQGISVPGYEKLALRRAAREGERETVQYFLVKKKAEQGLTGAFVSRAGVTRDPMSNTPQIILRFDGKGADLFGDITRNNVGRQLGIVLDGELYSAPRINEPITGGSAQITGDFTLKEALELSHVLENPLAAPLKIVDERGVDPSLGKDSIQSGIRASIIGITAVAVFMLVYYMFAGMVANIALIINTILLIGTMCAIGTTFTVPGIAGIVLTVGMAVDANVLIYERMREELAAGKSLRGAIVAGYAKAFRTIFDSHVTTLISSVILIWMGTGPVKGFGVALTIGVALSLFTALVITRLIFDLLINKGHLKSLPMLHIIKSANVDFLRWAKPAFITSWTVIAIGVGYGFYRGGNVMGVDFAGGDAVSLSYVQKIPTEQIRQALEQAHLGEATIQYQQGNQLQVTIGSNTGPQVMQIMQSKFPQAQFKLRSIERVGAIVG
ncbi:MAG TPA: protein translocase subunit SecD, partial [Verrucomicrobiae bacterium]|nr:protein translocase subunit SecD [Verrucomicrobiae bacterium]